MTADIKINYMAAQRLYNQIIWRPPDKLTQLHVCGSHNIIQFCGGRQIIKVYVATAAILFYCGDRRLFYYMVSTT